MRENELRELFNEMAKDHTTVNVNGEPHCGTGDRYASTRVIKTMREETFIKSLKIAGLIKE